MPREAYASVALQVLADDESYLAELKESCTAKVLSNVSNMDQRFYQNVFRRAT